jgi:hypothetical protein
MRRSEYAIDPMKASHLLCAMLVCAPLTFAACASASSEDVRSSAALAGIGEAAGAAAPGRNISTEAGRGQARTNGLVRSENGGGSKGRGAEPAILRRDNSVLPQRGVGQVTRSNADRVRSLLSAQARERIAKASSRVGPTRAAAGGNMLLRASPGASSVGRFAPAPSKIAARAAASLKAIAGNSTIGGPYSSGPGRLGGPTIGRTVYSATVDATQLHRKY